MTEDEAINCSLLVSYFTVICFELICSRFALVVYSSKTEFVLFLTYLNENSYALSMYYVPCIMFSLFVNLFVEDEFYSILMLCFCQGSHFRWAWSR